MQNKFFNAAQPPDNVFTAAINAAQSGRTDRLEYLLGQAPDLLKQATNSGETLVHITVWGGHKDTLELILDQAPDLLMQADNFGRTLAHVAVQCGHKDMLEYLLDQAPGLLMQADNIGATLAHYAAWGGHNDTLELILKKAPGLLMKTTNVGATLAHSAARGGHKDMLELILEKAPGLLKQATNSGETLEHSAALGGDKDTRQLIAFYHIGHELQQNTLTELPQRILEALDMDENRFYLWLQQHITPQPEQKPSLPAISPQQLLSLLVTLFHYSDEQNRQGVLHQHLCDDLLNCAHNPKLTTLDSRLAYQLAAIFASQHLSDDNDTDFDIAFRMVGRNYGHDIDPAIDAPIRPSDALDIISKLRQTMVELSLCAEACQWRYFYNIERGYIEALTSENRALVQENRWLKEKIVEKSARRSATTALAANAIVNNRATKRVKTTEAAARANNGMFSTSSQDQNQPPPAPSDSQTMMLS